MIHGIVSQSSELLHLPDFSGAVPRASRDRCGCHGIHVQDIAHVINHDLPEATETSFIVLAVRGEPVGVVLLRLSS